MSKWIPPGGVPPEGEGSEFTTASIASMPPTWARLKLGELLRDVPPIEIGGMPMPFVAVEHMVQRLEPEGLRERAHALMARAGIRGDDDPALVIPPLDEPPPPPKPARPLNITEIPRGEKYERWKREHDQ